MDVGTIINAIDNEPIWKLLHILFGCDGKMWNLIHMQWGIAGEVAC
jgi:hypothetical protein